MFVLQLSDGRATDRALCGGKGATLSRLVRAGFPVPDGFVVTSEAWRYFTGKGGSDGEILRAINDNFITLGTDSVAVRSSASVEDGKQASWAGQFSTFLDVHHSDLIHRIKDCMSSSRTDAVRRYGARYGVDPDSIRVAVVVQRMVRPESAGVAFSVDPVSGRTDTVVIEAVAGSGKTVVDGTATPDSYVLEKKTGEIRSAMHGVQPAHGTVSPEKLRELLDLILKTEEFFKSPQDIEWALAERLYLLQSRPITGF